MQTPGEILKAERERKGLSIKEVEQSTSIRSLYLSAIEEGNYSVVPGEVYLKGFIRNYAAFLGLNSQELVELYRQTQITPEVAAERKDLDKPTAKQPATTSQKVKEVRAASSPFKWAAVLVVPVIAAAGFWWYSQTPPESSGQMNNVKSAPSAPAQPAPAAPASPAPNVLTAPAQSKPVVVIAKFTDECWTQVMVDGREVYEGIPKIGESLTWEAQQTIMVTLGNASGVDITYNGKPQAKLGAKGDVLVKTFTPKQ